MTYLGPVAHDSGHGNLPIRRLVVHCTAGADAKGARGTARYFASSAATGSAHEVIDPKEVIICAYDDVVCWHAPPNPHSKGYELACSLSNGGKGHWALASHQAMLRLLAKEVARDAVKYSIPVRHLTVAQVKANEAGICGHVDVTNAFHQSSHTDPGPYFPWSQFIPMVAAEVAIITGGTGSTPTPPVPGTGDFTVAEADRVIAAVTELIKTTEGNRYEDLKKAITEWAEARDNERQAQVLAKFDEVIAAIGSRESTDVAGGRYADLKTAITTWSQTKATERQTVLVEKLDDLIATLQGPSDPTVPPVVTPPVVVPPKA
jgi:hypothetical protein